MKKYVCSFIMTALCAATAVAQTAEHEQRFFKNNLQKTKIFPNFATRYNVTEIMKENKVQFTRPLGAFRDSVRAYRDYKQKWQQRVNRELEEREESRRLAMAEMNLELV